MKRKYEEKEGAKERFDRAMKALFRAPKESIKKQARKPAKHRKGSDRK